MRKEYSHSFIVFVSTLFFILPLSPIQAENDFKFSHLTVMDGLLHNSATCITQDSLGFVWIGTQRGLNRYDGYKLDSYLHPADLYNSIFKNRIRKIAIAENYLWVATFSGLQCFDIVSKKYIDFRDVNNVGLANRQIIQQLFIDSKHRMWVSTTGKLECLLLDQNKKEPELKSVEINNSSVFNTASKRTPDAVELQNGVVIILSDGNTYQVHTLGTTKLTTKFLKLPLSNIRKMKAVGNDLWLFSEDKAIVVRQKNGVFEQIDAFSYLPCAVVGVEYTSSSVFVSTNHGIMKISRMPIVNRIEYHYHSVLDPNSVCSDHQSGILIDNYNNLWITTWSGGVSYSNIGKQMFELVKFMPIQSNKYLPNEFVYSIHEDNKGDIYVGTKFGGISRFNIQTKTFDYTLNLKEKLGINAVVPCIKSDDDWVYAAVTFQGSSIYRINKRNQRIELVKSYMPNTIFSFDIDKHKQLWVGILGIGLSCLKIENGKAISEKLFSQKSDPVYNLSSNEVNYVFSDKQKNEVLISTTNGINRLMLDDKGSVSAISYYLANEKNSNSLSSNYVWPIDKENDSTYWVGTMGSGLNRIIIGKREEGIATYNAERFGTKDGAPSNDIESVLVDKFGHVWCGGRYLSQFNYKTKKFKTYYEEDGIQSYLFGTGTSCKTRNGMLFFGGLKGMNYFTPDTTVEKKQYKIVFTRLLIDGKTLVVGDTLNGKIVLENDLSHISEVRLPYPCNNFTIEFSSLTYSQKKNIQYRYKLKGFDNDWVYINGLSPFAMYPKLPYKKYTFIVEVGSNNQWNNVVREMDIFILPPWWLSVWAYMLYTILVLLIIYFTARYSLNWINLKRQVTLQNEREKQKEELMELKMNFFTNISHEFKTPLTLINASVNEIESQNEQLFGNRYFQILKRNNSKLLHLISELMDFQRSNASLIELKTTEIDVCKFVQEIVEEFMPLAERSSIDMKLTLSQSKMLAWVDEECLVKIITNVISNSIRYTESGGKIEVKLSIGDLNQYQAKYKSKIAFTKDMQSGKQLIFSVSDTGVGISSESLPDIFERFHTIISKTSKHLGSGVGLALVKSLVELHKGGVLISSERFKGTEFVFSIPLESDYLTEYQKTIDNQFDRQLYFDDYKVQILDSEEIASTVNDETKPTLLIVDDNKDILMILQDHFKSEFNILLALDGKEALDICNEKYPDIIISDVMMPVMTGLEFCNKVKSQLNTCFIPVILLTARGTTEQQIEGIDEGADAYMPKPFHMGLLHATVVNLLNKSKLASSRKVANAEDVTANKAVRNLVIDQEKQLFIDKLTKLILNNIDNSDYSVEHLSLDIGISRSRLYGQIKSITNGTLGDFIREVRLQKAAELFRSTSMSISEVGFQVGMESPSFFTRSFKQRFDMLPSEYIKRIKNNEI